MFAPDAIKRSGLFFAVVFDAGIDDGLRIKYPYRNRHEHR